MKKQLLGFMLLLAMLCATQIQDANASKKGDAIKSPPVTNVKFKLSAFTMPTTIYLGRLQDPFVSYIQYDLYGSGNIITSAIEINGGVVSGSVPISNGHYRLESGTTDWYLDSGTITGYFQSFDFFEALHVDAS